jgi:hypothetical protein
VTRPLLGSVSAVLAELPPGVRSAARRLRLWSRPDAALAAELYRAEVRAARAELGADFGPTLATAAFALSSPDPHARAGALLVVVCLGATGALPAIEQWLDDPSEVTLDAYPARASCEQALDDAELEELERLGAMRAPIPGRRHSHGFVEVQLGELACWARAELLSLGAEAEDG